MLTLKPSLILLVALSLPACKPSKSPNPAWLNSLTFHASFDQGSDADFAKGDDTLYTMVMVRPDPVYEPGLPGEAVEDEAGRFGNCLFFNTPEEISGTRAFFKLKDNLPYAEKDWSGTISFWIRVTPDEDLRPGYTDPIQLTPRSALDGCLWVDFSLDEHRQFRMGAFPDKQYWNPENKPNKEIPDNERPLIPVTDPPFSRDHWSHIVMTFEGFNNPGKQGVAKLFIDGMLQDTLTGWEQIYTWDLESAQIRLGVNFVGAIDELSCFGRALNTEEIVELFSLKHGVTALLGN
jgi:hypothetical protein